MNTNSAVQLEARSRIHVGVAAKSLEKSIDFYASLLGQPPIKTRPRYAKPDVAVPHVNLSLNEVGGAIHAASCRIRRPAGGKSNLDGLLMEYGICLAGLSQ